MKRLNSKFTDSQYKLISSTQKKFRLYYAIMLKYYESHNKFLDGLPKISGSLLTNIAIKLDLETTSITIPSARAVRNYKIRILQHFNISAVKKTDKTDRIDLQLHLKNIISCEGIFEYEVLQEYAQDFIVKQGISSIKESSISRIVKSTIYQYEKDLFQTIVESLGIETKAYLDELLIITDGMSKMNHLMRWVRGTTIESIKSETEKLRFLKLLKYPEIVTTLTSKHLKRYYRNIVNKYPSTIKEMPNASKYAQLIIFCFMRKTDINDSLVEILLDTTQKIFIAGENKSKAKFSKLKEIKKNYDNRRVLKILVDTILGNEEDLINKAIYPKLPKKKLLDIQQQLSTKKLANKFSDLLYYSTRESFARYYRKVIVPIIEVLEFDSVSSNKITNVINLIKDNINNNKRYYYSNQVLEIEQTVQKSHRDKIFDKNNRVKKIDLELCVLNKLRNKLRSKEVWVKGGYKYRNPEEDLPQDFDQNKEKYFNILKQPQDADTFINTLKAELKNSLFRLNNSIPQNKFVHILKKPKGHIRVAKIKEQNPPKQLELIKEEVFKRWPSTSLLDILKEVDMFVNFTDDFVASGPKIGLDKEIICKRLLLAILGYGTNTGLKSMSNGEISYQDLQYIKLRYFDQENLQAAIRKIVNSLLKIRFTSLWGDNTTSVASDSKHFKASDQNLMSSWHPRYHSKGVMIYWHVDTSSVCIYSQMKSCHSSEVAAMLEGILKHATNANIDKNYVDTHGASEIGFAFSYLFSFALMPRFKNIHKQRLYYTDKEEQKGLNHIEDILVRPIDWELIKRHYEYIIQHAISLKLGIADTEGLLRKFTKGNVQHEAYQAIRELGRAVKTIFLCNYFNSLELRQEIHSALNVVERWNGVNDIIFYGKTGVFRSNNPLELKLSTLCLHLLQLSMVYINTLMLQQILVESSWLERMSNEDKRAISPLISEHINPYGSFSLDLNKRLAINVDQALFAREAA